ncbi:sulfotransferase ssu-1-like [Ornithodoros turicata]|uniref:sulfotransferase ssu-1-like n=1 Tax=Ornithodoros turicata TaxID=34597 RepID=UPI003139910B
MMSSSNARGFLKVVDGIVVPRFFKDECVTEAINYKAGPGDVFVATYPKSGTTWLQYIVWCLYNLDKIYDGVPNVYDMVYRIMPFIDRVGTAAIQSKPPPRCMKTHFSRDVIPYHAAAKYVVCVRNPFDCVVSYYHFRHDINQELAFDDVFDDFLSGKGYCGSYFDHVLSWYKHRHDRNVCFVYYEALKENPAGHVLKLADFLDPQNAGRRLRSDPGLLQKVVEVTSFQNLKNAAYTAKAEVDVEKMGWKGKHFRKGVVGDWKNELHEKQVLRLRQAFDTRLAGTEMKSVFEKYLN